MQPADSKPSRCKPPKNIGLLERIRAKRESHWKPSIAELRKGFRGWHQRGFLPHFDAPNVTQMVTFMLADSFPVKRNPELQTMVREADDSVRRRKIEAWLDRGQGECWLRRFDVARLIERTLLEGDETDYQMQAWCIMPNHVHLVVDVWDVPLTQLIHVWKGRSARKLNELLGRRGQLWQQDYFDTLIRDTEHLKRAIRYTEQNPTKARLVADPRAWQWSSGRHRDEYQRLHWQR